MTEKKCFEIWNDITAILNEIKSETLKIFMDQKSSSFAYKKILIRLEDIKNYQTASGGKIQRQTPRRSV